MPSNQPEENEDDYQDFDPYFSKKARMEVKLDEFGVSFVGNAEGYLSFARLFTYLAEIHTLIREEPERPETNTIKGYDAYHFKDFISEESELEGHYLFSPSPPEAADTVDQNQELFFWLSDVIGPDFWKS